jgi:hypothetical protein
MVDFPEPVEPTIATDLPAGTLKDRFYMIILLSSIGAFLS